MSATYLSQYDELEFLQTEKKVNTLSYNLPLIGYSHQHKDQRICYRTLLNIVHAIFQLALARPNWGLVFFLSFIAINLKF